MISSKYIKILKILIILLVTILLTNVIINNSNISLKNVSNYNVPKVLWRYRFNCGLLFQSSTSILSYLGISTISLLDEDVKNDMDAINWNIFNTNEQTVLSSKKVSFYKGVPVFKFNYNRSGSFLAIFLYNRTSNINTIRHEWGHNIQQLILGPIKYGLCIGLPSWLEWSNNSYYDRPWEITADIFGGVTRKHSISDILKGYSYLNVSALFSILSYSFLPGEY